MTLGPLFGGLLGRPVFLHLVYGLLASSLTQLLAFGTALGRGGSGSRLGVCAGSRCGVGLRGLAAGPLGAFLLTGLTPCGTFAIAAGDSARVDRCQGTGPGASTFERRSAGRQVGVAVRRVGTRRAGGLVVSLRGHLGGG